MVHIICLTSHKIDATTFEEEDAEMLRQADLEWEQNQTMRVMIILRLSDSSLWPSFALRPARRL